MCLKAISRNLKEVRVHLCQQSSGSSGVREFLKSTYAKIKLENPGFPFLIREAEGVPARLIARYDYGIEEAVNVEGAGKDAVQKSLDYLVQKGSSVS